MTPNFPETNEALYHTLTYFKVGRIAEQIRRLAGDSNLSYVDSWVDITIRSHKDMEAEINQIAIGSIPFIQQSLFEYLRDWLNNWQFNSGFEREIEYLIDQDNAKEYEKYKLEIEKDEAEYRKNGPPGVEYGKDYQVEVNSYFDIFLKKMMPKKMETRTFLFVTSKKPRLIDKDYLSQYISIVKKLIDSFRLHSKKYVTNYFAGKYPINVPVLSASNVIKELPAPTLQVNPTKLKVKITVKELLYLFKILIDAGVIEQPPTLKNLHEIVAMNFQTDRTDDMKVEKLQKWWSEIEATVAAYWENKFLDLHKLSQKDNPLRLKPKK